MCGGICKVGTFQETWFYTPNSNVKLDLTFSLFFFFLSPNFLLTSQTLFLHFFFSQSHSVCLSTHFLSLCSLKLSSHVMLFLIFCSHDHDLQWSSPSFIFYFSFSRPWASPSFFSFSFFHSHAFFELSSHLHLLWFEIWDLGF